MRPELQSLKAKGRWVGDGVAAIALRAGGDSCTSVEHASEAFFFCSERTAAAKGHQTCGCDLHVLSRDLEVNISARRSIGWLCRSNDCPKDTAPNHELTGTEASQAASSILVGNQGLKASEPQGH